MGDKKGSALKQFTDKLYGGLNMSWLTVILYAVGTAVLTAVFLIVPVFKNTSFERVGATLEAWIFFAIIIMANCRKPLESALKTFVFFLISQPLIYLFQVPFSWLGWQLFGFYKTWFIWTLLTFPMAYAGWYIKKKNWFSLLILTPALLFLINEYVYGFQQAYRHFPRLIVMAVFCLVQVLLYLYVFTENIWQKLLGFAIPLAAMLILLFTRSQVDVNSLDFLPGDPVLSENAVVEMTDNENTAISIERTGQDSMVRIQTKKCGTTAFVIKNGEKEYRYILEVYEDENGHTQMRISPGE